MPTQNETFAVSDIKELVAAGHTVDVQCLREAYKDSEALLKMYGLDSIPISHASMRTVLSLCWSLVASPRFTLSCFTIALRSAKLSPKHLRATLLLLPRAIEIVQAIHRSPPDIVHAFWGHYPSLVVLLLRRLGSKIPVTIFLGAYDLSEDYPITRLVLPEVDGVFTHAQANVPFLERCGIPPAQVKIVHRGIPIDDFERLEEGSRSCTQICTVSALEKSKRVDKVIAAFERILERDARATLLVIG